MGHPLRTLALAPWLLLQGKRVRRDTPRLPEPEGPRQGQSGEQGPRIKLLIVGDSAAAGVGSQTQAQALSGQLTQALAPHARIDWRLIAKTGSKAADTLAYLRKQADKPSFDIAVVSLGVNDITANTSLKRFIDTQTQLLDLLRDEYGVKHILLCGIPPLHCFPALPQPLRWYLGERGKQFDRALKQLAATRPDCRHVDVSGAAKVGKMASDGFHPGLEQYAFWGTMLAGMIREHAMFQHAG